MNIANLLDERGSIKPGTMVMIALALVFGGSAAFGVRALMMSEGEGGGKASNTVAVVMTARDIMRGSILSADDLTTREYRKAEVPAGAVLKVEEAIDRTASMAMVKGEPLLGAKLSPKGAGRGLAALIPKGKRAVTIQTPNVATAMAGLLTPGNIVDVMLTVTDTGANDTTGGGSTTTLLQRVEILAVDQRVDTPADAKADGKDMRSVTLLVTPRQASYLDLGQNRGILHLALRNADDDTDGNVAPVTMFDLKNEQGKPWDARIKDLLDAYAKAQKPPATTAGAAAKAAPAAPSPKTIRTIRGTNEGAVYLIPARP